MTIQLVAFPKPTISRTCFNGDRGCPLWHCTMPGTEAGIGVEPHAAWEDWVDANMNSETAQATNDIFAGYLVVLRALFGICL